MLDGETLRQALAVPIPVKRAIDYAIQIANGLAAAHEKGIVHRDLKPENIFITKDGRVKILDFGLAKLTEPEALAGSADAATISAGTTPGVVLGTLGYMSPEQCRGFSANAASDIFSFGAVLYEMVSGRQAFRGPTQADLMIAILKEDPPELNISDGTINPALERVVRRCLDKKPEQRFQSIRDVAFVLEAVLGTESISSLPPVNNSESRPRPRAIPLMVAAGLVAFLIGLGVDRWLRTAHSLQRMPASFSVALPAGAQLAVGLSPTIAISPDETHLAYIVAREGRSQLYVRAIDQIAGNPVPGSDGADGVFFSADSRWVGFFADPKLKKVTGGMPVSLCNAGAALGASWGADDAIVFAALPDAGLSRVSAAGGVPKVLTTPDFAKEESAYFWPEILPGGKAMVFTAFSSSGKGRIDMRNLETGERRTLVEEAMNARYSSAGYLVFGRAGALFAVPFDAQRVQITGPAIQVVDAVASTSIGGAQFSLSREGSLIYVSGGSPNSDRALVWVNRAGAAQPLPAPPRRYLDPRLAPDGRRLMVEIYPGPKGDLWLYEMDPGILSRFTFEGFENETPVWMPDSARVAFSSSRAGMQCAIFWKAVGTSSDEERLLAGDHHIHLTSVSSDGQLLAFTEYDANTQGDIWVLSLTGSHQAQPFLRTPFHEWGAVFSPDTHWIVYVSNESGIDEIYAQAFPGPGQKHQISTDGGTEPLWAPNGRELFYRNGRKMLAVSITTEPVFGAGKPRQLFEGPYERGLPLGHTNYDVSRDGRRFLMIKGTQQDSAASELNVRLNWVQELQHQAADR